MKKLLLTLTIGIITFTAIQASEYRSKDTNIKDTSAEKIFNNNISETINYVNTSVKNFSDQYLDIKDKWSRDIVEHYLKNILQSSSRYTPQCISAQIIKNRNNNFSSYINYLKNPVIQARLIIQSAIIIASIDRIYGISKKYNNSKDNPSKLKD